MGESEENDLKQVEDRLAHKVDDLQRRGEEVSEHIETARDDWQRKRNDPSVPGAVPPDDDQGAEPKADDDQGAEPQAADDQGAEPKADDERGAEPTPDPSDEDAAA